MADSGGVTGFVFGVLIIVGVVCGVLILAVQTIKQHIDVGLAHQPAPGTYIINKPMGQGLPDSSLLTKAVVSNTEIVFHVTLGNSGSIDLQLSCPASSSDLNGWPSVTFENDHDLSAIDCTCAKIPGRSWSLRPGQTFEESATYSRNKGFSRPFRFWWYGHTADDVALTR